MIRERRRMVLAAWSPPAWEREKARPAFLLHWTATVTWLLGLPM